MTSVVSFGVLKGKLCLKFSSLWPLLKCMNVCTVAMYVSESKTDAKTELAPSHRAHISVLFHVNTQETGVDHMAVRGTPGPPPSALCLPLSSLSSHSHSFISTFPSSSCASPFPLSAACPSSAPLPLGLTAWWMRGGWVEVDSLSVSLSVSCLSQTHNH